MWLSRAFVAGRGPLPGPESGLLSNTQKNELSEETHMLAHLQTLLGRGFPGGSEVKASACNAGDLGSIPGSGRSPGEGNGNPLQYSCLENPMDGGAWGAIVHGVAESQTGLSDFTWAENGRVRGPSRAALPRGS